MRKTILALTTSLVGLLALPSLVSAEQYDNLVKLPLDQNQAALIEEVSEGEVLGTDTVALVADEMVDQGPHFFYGEEQIIDEDLIGDVYVVAGKVEVNANIDGDLMVLGGTVILNGDITQDVRAGAGTIYVNGMVGQNLTVGGGQVYFGENAKIGNSVVAGGGDVNLDGQTMGKVLLGGGAARLAGQYGSDVHAQADTFKVMPGVVVNGSLIADAYTSADVAPDAQILREKMVKVIPPEEQKRPVQAEKMKPVGGILVKAALLEFMFKFLIGLVSGSMLIYFLPKLVKNVKTQVQELPMANFGWGLIYLFMAPIVIFFALVSVVAMPIAGLMALVYMGSMIVAKTFVAMAIGDRLVQKLKLKAIKNPYLSFAFGLLVLKMVGYLPILGWLVSCVAFVVGMGAVFTLMKNYLFNKTK